MEKTVPSAAHLGDPPVDPIQAQRAIEFMQAVSEGLLFYNRDEILDCNDAFAHLVGRTPESLIGTSALALFPVADQEVAARHMFLGLNTPYLSHLPHSKNHANVNVEITERAWHYKGRSCWVATVQDTSSVGRIAQSLVRSQARYRTLVENADQVILFVQERNVAYANPAAIKFFKLQPDAIRSILSVHLIHPDDRPLALARRKAMIAGDPDHSVVLRTISPPTEKVEKNSVVSWVRFYGSLVEWEGQAATLIFMTDLTAQRETEESMRKALAQEKELGDLKTRFVSMASHEFRTPLSTIQTSSELLEHYSQRLSEREKKEALADIQRAVQRMQAMVSNFLAFGRMSAGAMQCHAAPVALLAVVRSVVQETLAAASQKPEVLVNALAPLLDTTELMLDEVLLRQMLGNLLGNACKYSTRGTPVEVTVRMQHAPAAGDGPPQPHLHIVVADHGIGIPADDLPLLFESFHRAANAVNLPGTGLGLAIVDRAVRAHGGKISVHSVEGEGTQFELVLPWMPVADN
jgi:PAS domain S-box-containing protein